MSSQWYPIQDGGGEAGTQGATFGRGIGTGGHPQNVGEFYGGCDMNGDFMVILWWFYGDSMVILWEFMRFNGGL